MTAQSTRHRNLTFGCFGCGSDTQSSNKVHFDVILLSRTKVIIYVISIIIMCWLILMKRICISTMEMWGLKSGLKSFSRTLPLFRKFQILPCVLGLDTPKYGID